VVTLVAAVEILRRLGLDAHLALAGLVDERQAPEFVRYWSDCRDSMRTLARNLGIADRVHELPPTADMRPFYSACDATLLLSFAEGSPCMVWESLAAGVPVVSTHVGDVRNVATPETGSFVLPDLGDLATVAAGALNSIATRAPAIRERCRQAAVRRVRDLADVDRWQREDLPRMIEALTGGT
jgi:glycosyltransferase involved in cell wall biosynthesis